MTTAGYVFDSESVPLQHVAPPTTFAKFDFYPAAELHSSLKALKAAGKVLERSDELGACFVAHFNVAGTALYLYSSAGYPPDTWLLFVDMNGCIAHEQKPTKVAANVLRFLKLDSKAVLNTAVDRAYRGRLAIQTTRDISATAGKTTQRMRAKRDAPSIPYSLRDLARNGRVQLAAGTGSQSSRKMAARKAPAKKAAKKA